MRLNVELYDQPIGTLHGDDNRTFDFSPDPTGIEVFGLGSRVLSVTTPLVARPQRSHANRRRNFFHELLPEGDHLDYLLQQSGVRRGDTMSFLAHYGRDIAGALQIWCPDDPTEPKVPSTKLLTDAEIKTLLTAQAANPLANDAHQGKTSLAGVQPKIVLAQIDGSWHQVLGGYPSTHILKPAVTSRPTEIFDEEYGSRFVRALHLAAFTASLRTFAGVDALVIERFDRNIAAPGVRVHQEDFNQALGAHGNQKYQDLSGVVSLLRVAQTLKSHADSASLERLAAAVTLSVALTNLDMHTKNLGLLHSPNGDITLAPIYDFVPHGMRTNIGSKMVLAVNGKYSHRTITGADIITEIQSWGYKHATKVVRDTLEVVLTVASTETPSGHVVPGLAANISATTRRLLNS